MATYVLIHGAGDVAWSWHLVAAELGAIGHEVVAVDLPSEDDAAGFSDYADAVIEAVGHRTELIVVAHSLGAFTAPIVCDRVAVDLLVLLAAMVPLPGERAEEWWRNTGYPDAGHDEIDEVALYMHDVPRDLAAEALARGRRQSGAPMEEPWPLTAWPDVPTVSLLCRDDHMFPVGWMRGVVRKRLGMEPDEIDGSHCVFLSRPQELAERLEHYRAAGGRRARLSGRDAAASP